jgi:cytosine deaminase
LYAPARKSRLWSDNIHDLFIPTGSGDILDIALLKLLSGHFLAGGFGMVPHAAAELMGLGANYGLRPGARADMVTTDGQDAERLGTVGPDKMIVVSKGRQIGANAAVH